MTPTFRASFFHELFILLQVFDGYRCKIKKKELPVKFYFLDHVGTWDSGWNWLSYGRTRVLQVPY